MTVSKFTPPRILFSGKGNYIDLARIIGMACVVYGHCLPFNQAADVMVRNVIYSFHMPLFFMISGILEKAMTNFNWQYFKKMCYCLLLPYIIYNIPYVPLFFTDSKNFVVSMLTASVPPNDPTWFFFALFMVKIIMAIFAKVRIYLLPLAIVAYCILEYSGVYLGTIFCVHAILTGLIFYETGRLVKDIIKVRFILLLLPITFLLTYRGVTQFVRYDMYWGNIDNPIWYLCTAVTGSMAVLMVCKYVSDKISAYINDYIVYPVSRGTMVIVGTHYIFAHFANRILFQVYDNLLAKWLYTVVLLGIYWILIEITFKRIPVLYGKSKIE